MVANSSGHSPAPSENTPMKLDAAIRMVHGDEVVASNERAPFEDRAATYEKWLAKQES